MRYSFSGGFLLKGLFWVLMRNLPGPICRYRRRRLRNMMRGYRHLKASKSLHSIEDAIQHLRDYPLSIPAHFFYEDLWGAALPHAELILRQRLSSRYLELNKALLIASCHGNQAVISPLPRIWREQLELLGFKLDNAKCSFLWKLELGKSLLRGFMFAVFALIDMFLNWQAPNSKPARYIYFCDLTQSNLPSSDTDDHSFCLINWYRTWNQRSSCISELRHGVPNTKLKCLSPYSIHFQRNPIPPLLQLRQKIFFMLWLSRAFSLVAKSILGRYWWNILIIDESVTASIVRVQASSLLASEYWFHNSKIYPPLWSYELMAKGSKLIYYFYSTNWNPLSRHDSLHPFLSPYSITNWPTYLFWDEKNISFIKHTENAASEYIVAGPIWFTDEATSFQSSRARSVSVFDLQPFRSSKYQGYCFTRDYLVPNVSMAFLSEILECAARLNVMISFKRKRNIGKLAHPLYRRLVENLANHPNVTLIDSSVSPMHLIRQSIGCISMPFTSVAHYAVHEKLPSVYYDPTSSIAINDPASFGVPVLNDKKALFDWMRSLISKD